MPKFFFHILHGDGSAAHDDEGVELQDYVAAEKEATQSLRELTAVVVKGGRPVYGLSIQITGEDGYVLGTVVAQDFFH